MGTIKFKDVNGNQFSLLPGDIHIKLISYVHNKPQLAVLDTTYGHIEVTGETWEQIKLVMAKEDQTIVAVYKFSNESMALKHEKKVAVLIDSIKEISVNRSGEYLIKFRVPFFDKDIKAFISKDQYELLQNRIESMRDKNGKILGRNFERNRRNS